MLSDFGLWVDYFLRFMYDTFYTIKIPGLNIPILYFFVIVSTLGIVIRVFQRILFDPHQHKNSKGGKSKNADAS